MKCDIIILVWNEKILTAKCIDSIRQNTHFPYRILIIDNGSDPETSRYLKELADKSPDRINLKRNDENLGFPKAVNQAISVSDAPYICILNNDTEVYNGWLTEMIRVAESSADIGIVNPASNNLGRKYTMPIKEDFGKFIEMSVCIGFCMLVKREVIDKIGKLDEIYTPGNFEDTDFSKRAVGHGYRCVMAKAAYVHHSENTSFKKRKDWNDRFKRNQRIFYDRWGAPKRIAYIISETGQKEKLDYLRKDILLFLRQGDRVWIFSKEDFSILGMPEHMSLTFSKIKTKGFGIVSIWRVVKRKKRFNKVFTDNRCIYTWLKNLRLVSKSEVSLMGNGKR